MSNTQLALPTDIPAHIRAQFEKAAEQNKQALGGIKAGSFPRISIGGSKFSIVENGEKTLIADPDKPELPAMELQGVIVGFNRAVSKLYYEGEFEEGSDKEPTCSSDNGVTPDPHIVNPPSRGCAACPKNVWGSKTTQQGKQVKACSDNKRLVFISSHNLADETALDLTIKPASLKTWAEYVRALDSKGISVDNVVTKIQFDASANYPKLVFKFGRFLTPAELPVAEQRSKGDDVRLIAMPRTSTSTGPAPVAQGVPAAVPAPAPTPVAPVAPSAPAVAPTPPAAKAPDEVAPVVADPYEGQPAHVRLAVEASGGLNSPTGQQVYQSLTGKSVAEQPASKPVDPYEGLAAHVKLAVEAAGGLDSDAGKQTYAALGGKATTGYAPAKRTRGPNKTTAAPAPAAAPLPATAAAPATVAPAQSFATPPASTTGSLGGDLDALLKLAMETPTK